jgi:hypothetical protein
MWRHILFALPLCALIATPGPPVAQSQAPGKRALLVGIARYDRGQQDAFRNLSSGNDVKEMKRVLRDEYGFQEADIHVLADAEATRAGIVKGFQEYLIQPARPGDVVVFEFSGHGQPVADDNGDELDGKDETLVPYDYRSQRATDGAKTNLRDDQLGQLLGQLRRKMLDADGQVKGNITLIIDSCHSGTITRGRLVFRGRSWDPRLDGPEPQPRAAGVPGNVDDLLELGGASTQGFVVLSACRDDESAADDVVEPGYPQMGVFTFYLARALRAARVAGQSTYRQVYERVEAEVTGQYPSQTPQLVGEQDNYLFASGTRPDRAYPLVQRFSGDRVTLSVGELHGTTVGSRFALARRGTDPAEQQNRVAEVEITTVDSATSEARLLEPFRGKLKAGALKTEDLTAARAVETAHSYRGDQLKVFFQGWDRPETTLKSLEVATTAGVTEKNYDVIVRRKEGRVTLERNDGSLLARFADDERVPGRLREALLGVWRWQFLSRLANRDAEAVVKIDMRLVPVDVELDPAGRGVTRIKGDRTDVTPTGGGGLVLHEGDFVQIELRNPSPIPVYVTVLDLRSNGGIGPLFPHPKLRGAGDRLIPAGATYRVPYPFVFRLEREYPDQPAERELFKVIATREDADFSSLLYEPEVKTRGPGILEEFTTRGGPVSPLAKLLYTATTGTRAVPAAVEPGYWATKDVGFGLRSK